MVESGATHNFMTPECAKKLSIKLYQLAPTAVSFAQGNDSNVMAAYGVRIHAGAWSAKLDFLVVPMDNFEMIVGMAFIDKYLICNFGKRVDQLMLDMQGNGITVKCKRCPSFKKKVDAQ